MERRRARIKKKGGPGRKRKKKRSSCSRLSAALIFNDILQRARVPLMHRHYNTARPLFSPFHRPAAFSSPSFLSFIHHPPDNASLKVSRDFSFRPQNVERPLSNTASTLRETSTREYEGSRDTHLVHEK